MTATTDAGPAIFRPEEAELLAQVSSLVRQEADRIAANCQVSEVFAFVDEMFLELLRGFWDLYFQAQLWPRLHWWQQAAAAGSDGDLERWRALRTELDLAFADYQRGKKGAARRLAAILKTMAEALAQARGTVMSWLQAGTSWPVAGPAPPPLPSWADLEPVSNLVHKMGQKRCCGHA